MQWWLQGDIGCHETILSPVNKAIFGFQRSVKHFDECCEALVRYTKAIRLCFGT